MLTENFIADKFPVEAEVLAEAQESRKVWSAEAVALHFGSAPTLELIANVLNITIADATRSAAQQPPAPCPKCAEAERIEALATAKLGDEIIKNGSLQDRLAQLECDFALEHDDKLELQAKAIELEKKWLEEQALNLAEEADYELMGQQLANAESMAGLDAEMNRELRAKVAEQDVLINTCERMLKRFSTHFGSSIGTGTLSAIADYKRGRA